MKLGLALSVCALASVYGGEAGAIAIAGEGGVSITGEVGVAATATIAGEGGVSITAEAGYDDTATIEGEGGVSVTGEVGVVETATIEGEGGVAVTGAVGLDPTTLALTGYWRGSFSASPWVGVASAGTSTSQDAVNATNPPAAGSTVNSIAPADFDGVNDSLILDDTLNTYANVKAIEGWALVNVPTGATEIIFYEATTRVALIVNNGVASFALNGGAVGVTRSLSIDTWQLITFRYNGTNVQVGVNEAPGAAGGASTASYSTNISSLAGGVAMGRGGANGTSGMIMELAFADVAISDADFGNIKTYVNATYALAL